MTNQKKGVGSMNQMEQVVNIALQITDLQKKLLEKQAELSAIVNPLGKTQTIILPVSASKKRKFRSLYIRKKVTRQRKKYWASLSPEQKKARIEHMVAARKKSRTNFKQPDLFNTSERR